MGLDSLFGVEGRHLADPFHGRPAASSSEVLAMTTRMVAGDESAYREFYNQFFDRLLRYLFVITHGEEQAARDALQATLLRVVRHMKKFDSEEVLWSWLTVLARSAAIDEQRKQKRYRGLLDRFFRREQIQADAPATDSDSKLECLLQLSLVGLTAEERELIELKYFNGQTVAAIAEALSTTEKAIESRLVRVRGKLKSRILSALHHDE